MLQDQISRDHDMRSLRSAPEIQSSLYVDLYYDAGPTRDLAGEAYVWFQALRRGSRVRVRVTYSYFFFVTAYIFQLVSLRQTH